LNLQRIYILGVYFMRFQSPARYQFRFVLFSSLLFSAAARRAAAGDDDYVNRAIKD